MVNEQQIFDKVVGLITPFAKNQAVAMQADTKILDDLGVNSARLVDIVLAFEDEFDIEVDDEAADEIWTIGDAVKLINSELN
ncbi:phosphopantetheine-binding protein [bacterium]|nr:phosphopantetheine-binding protein [bacterium]